MTVNLSERSDTGNINQSPVSSMASSIIHPCLQQQYVYIPGKKNFFKCDTFDSVYQFFSVNDS